MAQITSSPSRTRRRWLTVGTAACVGIGFVAFAFTWVAQSAAVPSIGLIALSLPALWLVRPGLRRPYFFLLCALAYSLLAGALTTSANVNADVAVIGFSVVALILLLGAIAVWRVGATRDWYQVRTSRVLGAAGWSDVKLQRSAIGLAVLLWAIAVAGAVVAIGPGKVWGARSLGQLATLIAHPGLAAWWGALVGADGLAGAACVAWFGRRLGLSWFASAIAAVLWATCPARVWPSAMHLAPTFLAPLAAAAALLALRDRSSALGIVVAIAFVVAAITSPIIAVVIGIEVVVAVALSWRAFGSGARAIGAAIVALVIAIVDAGLRPIGVWSLFGAVEPMRALGADGALPWESLAPPTLLPQLFGIEQHAGSAFWSMRSTRLGSDRKRDRSIGSRATRGPVAAASVDWMDNWRRAVRCAAFTYLWRRLTLAGKSARVFREPVCRCRQFWSVCLCRMCARCSAGAGRHFGSPSIDRADARGGGACASQRYGRCCRPGHTPICCAPMVRSTQLFKRSTMRAAGVSPTILSSTQTHRAGLPCATSKR